jgi:hypothetical protein
VDLFGRGFGASRGSSRVTIGGVEVANYLTWGQGNAHNPFLDLIVVQPGPGVTGGPVVVMVDGLSTGTRHSFTANGGTVYVVALDGTDGAA